MIHRFPKLSTLPRILLLLGLLSMAGLIRAQEEGAGGIATGNAIFIHPDGSGLQHWNACRMLNAGPDGEIAWDRLPQVAIYRGHMKDGLVSTSHGGATTHAYGVKVPADSYGMHGQEELTALSGYAGSIMQEAQERGKAVGIVNSGHIGEPGTGVFLASHTARGEVPIIAEKILTSGAQVMLCGGEIYMLPEGEIGFHGQPGVREDGRNLIAEAKEAGYTVVYDREQLMAVDTEATDKLLGVFAAKNTYNDLLTVQLRVLGLPLYNEGVPTVAEMERVALDILKRHDDGFLLVLEEEGSDNFSNNNNAPGAMAALTRADEAIAVALDFLEEHPDTLIITAADSDAGGLQVVSPGLSQGAAFPRNKPLPAWMRNGAPLHGTRGQHSPPFLSAPDVNGQQFTFGIAYAGYTDVAGGIISRAAGLNAERLGDTADNTDIYRVMYMTLFGEDLASPVRPEGDQAALPGEETGRKVTTITIDADGNYSTENGPLKLEEITAYLRENADPQTYVRIAASEKAKFEGVKALLDQVAKAQVKEITFEARTSEQAGQLKTSPL